MPYHTNTPDKMKQKIDSRKEEKERKPRKKTQKELFQKPSGYKNISSSEMKKLKEHSKLHKGGFQSMHMKNMIKFMEKGDSFSKAHNKAKALDKK